MADTITVTADLRHPKTSGSGNPTLGILSGIANITSYDTAKVAVTAITGQFGTGFGPRVVCDGVSSNGYAMRWDNTAKAFRAYLTGAALNGVLGEATVGVNVGTFNWVAVGQLRG